MTYAEKLKDPRWQKKRLEIFSRSNFSCEECGATDKTLAVHHLFYERGKPPWDEKQILKGLCEGCHEKRYHAERDLALVLADMKASEINAITFAINAALAVNEASSVIELIGRGLVEIIDDGGAVGVLLPPAPFEVTTKPLPNV